MVNMTRLMRFTAMRFRNEVALVNVERDRRFTFGELDALTNRITRLLTGRFGLQPGDRYATLLENDNMGIFHLWSLKSPASALWLGFRDSYDEHLDQIDRIRPRVIFLEEALIERYAPALKERGIAVVSLGGAGGIEGVAEFWSVIHEVPGDPSEFELVADDARIHACLLKFTGGTTGVPKCAAYSLQNLLSAAANSSHYSEVMPFDRPRALLSTPITHAAGALALPVYFRGGTVYTTNRFDLEPVCRTIEKERIDLIYTVPTVLYKMLEAGLTRKYDLRSLKTIRYGASPISPAKLERLMQEFGPVFVQGYASTESWPPGTILGRAEHGIGSEREIRRLASVGRPVPGIEVIICDDGGREVTPGDSGEIWLRGPNTIAGYLDDPEQTAANFSEDGFWKSGDVGYMDEEGFLYLVDRKKDMIISGGFNVYAVEVENVLNSHPAVENSAVVGIPDEYWGEAVCGVVLLKNGQSADEKDLMEFCKDRLARYKAPKKIEFVRELPTSPVGKVLRREVKRRYWQDGGRGIH